MNFDTVYVILESNLLTKKFGSNLNYNDRVDYLCEIISHKQNDKLVLNMVGEGLFSVNLAKTLIQKLNLKPEKTKLVFMYDVREHFPDFEIETNYMGLCNGWNFYKKLQKYPIDWQTINLNYFFVALANRPSVTRALYIKSILDFFQDKSLISFGSNEKIDYEVMQILKPYSLPISIDLKNSDMTALHNVPNDLIFKALFNIVFETNPPQSQEVRITEKTFKSFAWHQIPIFVANKKIIEILREFKFDLFDDLLDYHSYADYPQNQQLKIISLLKKITNTYQTLQDLENLRNSLYTRLNYNNMLLGKLVENDNYDWARF